MEIQKSKMPVLIKYKTYDDGEQILDVHKDSEASYPSHIGVEEHTAEDITVLSCVALRFSLKNARRSSHDSPRGTQRSVQKLKTTCKVLRGMILLIGARV
jgi:hypothetical protein